MKKVLIIFCMMLFMGEVYAQQQVSDTLRFMNDYRKFVSFVVSQPSLTKPVADSLIARQDTLMHQYRSLKYRGDRFTDGLEATGDSISKAAGRAGKAVGGFFKGLFE